MSFPVRRLGASDVAAMRQLNDLFGQAFGDDGTYAANPPSDDYMARLLSKDHLIVLTAWDGAKITGGLVAYELDKFEMARSEIYIYDLAVAEAYRRKGIATALIGQLRNIASERDAWVIYVQADHGDDPAIALYTKLGAREDVMHFDIAVPGTRARD